MSATPEPTFATVPTSGRGGGQSRRGVSLRKCGHCSSCRRTEARSLFGDNSPAVYGACNPSSPTRKASQLIDREPYPFSQPLSAVSSPLLPPNHEIDRLCMAYIQPHILRQSTANLAASLDEGKKTLVKLHEDVYNVLLEKHRLLMW